MRRLDRKRLQPAQPEKRATDYNDQDHKDPNTDFPAHSSPPLLLSSKVSTHSAIQ
jgi:hypothetical protein